MTLCMAPNVTVLDTVTTLDIPVARILDGARHCESVMVIGMTPEGDYHFASSFADGGTALWYMEKCKAALLNIGD